MSRLHRIGILAGALTSAAALAATMAGPAQAASSPGWRVFYRHHYGVTANYSGYLAVVAPGKTDAWAFGSGNLALPKSPVAAHWNGARWSVAALPAGLTSVINDASAPSSGDIWATSQLGQYVLRWNGKKWSVAHRWTAAGQLTGVTALSAMNVWVFGGGGFIGGLGTWHYNGHGWTKFSGAASGIDRGSAVSASNIWAIGSVTTAQDSLVHYNGTRWARVSATALKNAQFNDIAAISRTNVWAVGEPAGTVSPALVVHWNGQQWQKVAVPWKVQPSRVISDGQGGLWIAATSGTTTTVTWVLHRSKSGQWTRVHIATGPGRGLFGLALDPGTHAVWGAGEAATKTASDGAVFASGRVG
jgi:hypothetical protein